MNEKQDVIIQTVKGILEVRGQQPNRLDHAGTMLVKSGVLQLKQLGLSNREIFEALDGAWSVVAIKQMTTGASAKDPEARRSFGQVLNEITTSDYTGADLERLRPIVRSRIDHNLAMEFLENVAQIQDGPSRNTVALQENERQGDQPRDYCKNKLYDGSVVKLWLYNGNP